MLNIQLIIFPILWLAALGGIYILTSKGAKLNINLLILHVAFMAMLGPIGEILVGTLYELVFGYPLWQYQVLPTHNAYTSYYAPVIWGIAGAYLYFTHEILRAFSKKRKLIRTSVVMVETILVEAALNLSFLAISGNLIFYYTPGDLAHITSLQTLPFYFGLGLVVLSSIKRLRRDPVFYIAMCSSLMFVTVYLTS